MSHLGIITFSLNGTSYSLLIDGARCCDIDHIFKRDSRLTDLRIESLTFIEATSYLSDSLFLDFNSTADLFSKEVLSSISFGSSIRPLILSLIDYHISHDFLG